MKMNQILKDGVLTVFNTNKIEKLIGWQNIYFFEITKNPVRDKGSPTVNLSSFGHCPNSNWTPTPHSKKSAPKSKKMVQV